MLLTAPGELLSDMLKEFQNPTIILALSKSFEGGAGVNGRRTMEMKVRGKIFRQAVTVTPTRIAFQELHSARGA